MKVFRPFVQLVFALLVATSAVAQPVSWRIGAGDTNSERFVFRPTLPVTLDASMWVRLGTPPGPKTRIVRYVWRVTGVVPGETPQMVDSGPRSGAVITLDLAPGTYRATLTATAQSGQTAQVEKAILAKEIHIGTMGDSFAAGEGNPNVLVKKDPLGFVRAGAVWSDTEPGSDGKRYSRCHRSEKAASVLATSWLAGRQPYPVDLRSLACSGAQIDIGILNGYEGIEVTPGGPALLPTQLEAMGDETPGGNKLDALVLGIGGNDIGFAPIAMYFAVHDLDGNPDSTAIDAKFMSDLNMLYVDQSSGPAGSLARVATSLKRIEPFKSATVFLMEYPNIFAGSQNRTCNKVLNEVTGPVELGAKAALLLLELDGIPTQLLPSWPRGGITNLEMGHLEAYLEGVDPMPTLNGRLASAVRGIDNNSSVADPRWVLVDGISAAFGNRDPQTGAAFGHGYCGPEVYDCKCASGESWVRTFTDSKNFQDNYSGTLHPNELGQNAMGKRLLETMEKNLFTDMLVTVDAPSEVTCGVEATYTVRVQNLPALPNQAPSNIARDVFAAAIFPDAEVRRCQSQADVDCRVNTAQSSVSFTAKALGREEGRAGMITVVPRCTVPNAAALVTTATVNTFTPDAVPDNNVAISAVPLKRKVVTPLPPSPYPHGDIQPQPH